MFDFTHLVALVVLWLVYKIYQWRNNVLLNIPGPSCLPFIGNLHQLDPIKPHIQFTKWKDVYGDIFRVNSFGQYSVVVNSMDGIKDVLINKGTEFGGRPQTLRARLFGKGCNIGSVPHSTHLQHKKKVGYWAMRSYAVGIERLEAAIADETKKMLDRMSEFKGQPFDPIPFLHTVVCNIMTSIILGKGFKSTDEEVLQVLLFDKLFNVGLHPINGAELDAFPWLRCLGNACYRTLKHAAEMRDTFIEKHFKICKEALNPDNIKGIFDALFVNQMSSTTNRNSDHGGNDEKCGPAGKLDDDDIKGIINDFIIAGTATTTSTMTVSLLVLINNPDIRKKLQAQVDESVPKDCLPALKDRSSMPYVDAFVFEVLRYSSILPLAVPHSTTVDTAIGGYEVPKGTQVLANLWTIHHDEKNYPNPWSFQPERFLDNSGQLVAPDHPNRRNLMAFGAGRRICIGEHFAKARLFLLLSGILQKFDVIPEDTANVPSSDPRRYRIGLVLFPEQFNVRVVERDGLVEQPN